MELSYRLIILWITVLYDSEALDISQRNKGSNRCGQGSYNPSRCYFMISAEKYSYPNMRGWTG